MVPSIIEAIAGKRRLAGYWVIHEPLQHQPHHVAKTHPVYNNAKKRGSFRKLQDKKGVWIDRSAGTRDEYAVNPSETAYRYVYSITEVVLA
jgi:hypothetical protein